jgi:hypothetical protein
MADELRAAAKHDRQRVGEAELRQLARGRTHSGQVAGFERGAQRGSARRVGFLEPLKTVEWRPTEPQFARKTYVPASARSLRW